MNNLQKFFNDTTELKKARDIHIDGYRLIYCFHNLFKKYNIKYSIIYGNVIAYKRNKEQILYDDDFDIQVDISVLANLLKNPKFINDCKLYDIFIFPDMGNIIPYKYCINESSKALSSWPNYRKYSKYFEDKKDKLDIVIGIGLWNKEALYRRYLNQKKIKKNTIYASSLDCLVEVPYGPVKTFIGKDILDNIDKYLKDCYYTDNIINEYHLSHFHLSLNRHYYRTNVLQKYYQPPYIFNSDEVKLLQKFSFNITFSELNCPQFGGGITLKYIIHKRLTN
tara:strand:+ start:1017 stop:1856 length:840 start_codon:yes stop_codon:yes gene_type:complete